MPSHGLAEVSAFDAERITRWAASYELLKKAAQFNGRRPRRYALRSLGIDEMMPPGSKRLHFIRHGEGHHNVWRKAAFDAGETPKAKRSNYQEVPQELYDPSLTETGKSEAVLAKAAASSCRPQLLVTSPLRRAVQTLFLAFEDSIAAGTPIIAHELCREMFHGSDPSIYDARKGRKDLAKEFPTVDFESFVLPEEYSDAGPTHALQGIDPIWWHCSSPLGCCEAGYGIDEAACVESAWAFLTWIMDRPETDIAVATHSFFLLCLYHSALEPESGDRHPSLQLFNTGELRSVVVAVVDPPIAAGQLCRWGPALCGQQGLRSEDEVSKKQRLV